MLNETTVPDAIGWLLARNDRELTLHQLIAAGIDRLPLPGAGRTLLRWQVLAAVAAHDLSLVKLFEGHTDALAIQAELGAPSPPPGSRWGTWCAEPPNARLTFSLNGATPDVTVSGTKAWCSGAALLTHAVVSGWNETGAPCLAAIALGQPGVTITDAGWHAVGMVATRSVEVQFDRARAILIGEPGAYTSRAGFCHGGAGIAACWWGGAAGIANVVRAMSGPGGPAPDPHRLSHLGAIDVALAAAAALLRDAACWIDADPRADAQAVALRVRLAVEDAANAVMRHAGRALGAGPLCRDARFARAMADLPVFLRQSHAERDLAALGAQILIAAPSIAATAGDPGDRRWML